MTHCMACWADRITHVQQGVSITVWKYSCDCDEVS